MLNENILLTGDYNGAIRQWKIEGDNLNLISIKENAHNNTIYSIIKIGNGCIISGSRDNSIIFYNKDNNNKYIQDYKLNTKGYCFSVIETKDNEICYSESHNTIYFYDLLQKKEISKINDINTNGTTLEGFIMINKELLLIPGINKISIININTHNLLKIIDVPNSNKIISVCKLNENILLTGDSNKAIRQWKIEGDILILNSIKENAYNIIIYSIIKIGDGHIISGSRDKLIKIW
jgi:WD40 repeat protein